MRKEWSSMYNMYMVIVNLRKLISVAISTKIAMFMAVLTISFTMLASIASVAYANSYRELKPSTRGVLTGASKTFALVVGNSNYETSPLANPVNDAIDMAQALSDVGFEVLVVTDSNKAGLETAINEFARRLRTKEVGLFFMLGMGGSHAGVTISFHWAAELRKNFR